MNELKQEYLDVLKNEDWTVSAYLADGRVEIEKYSPAGEDFSICVDFENFPAAVARYSADFDPDEHIEMWIEARHNGTSGVPSTRELVQDADDIQNMLNELAEALRREEEIMDLNRWEKFYERERDKNNNVTWIGTAIALLRQDIEDASGKKVEVRGPFGLRAETMFKLEAGDDAKYLTVIPDFNEGKLRLFYDTGDTTGTYQPGTLGFFNGFQNKSERLPSTVHEVVALFRKGR